MPLEGADGQFTLESVAETKRKGDLAELRIASDLLRQGHRVAIPFGEDWDYDLVLCRHQRFERVQVKYTESDGEVVHVRCRSHSLTGGRVRAVKHYTAAMVDWIAVYDQTVDACFYVPSRYLGNGRATLSLRLVPARNGQRAGINMARDFADLDGASRIRTDGLLRARQAL